MSDADTDRTTSTPPSSPAPEGSAEAASEQRGDGFGRMLTRYGRIAPASIALAVVVLATSIVTGTLWSAATVGGDALVWAAGVTTTIRAGFWWTPFTALFVPEDLAQTIIAVVLALTVMAA